MNVIKFVITNPTYVFTFFQAQKRFNAIIQQEEGALPSGRLLLEKEERWENNKGRPHEAESTRNRGKSLY